MSRVARRKLLFVSLAALAALGGVVARVCRPSDTSRSPPAPTQERTAVEPPNARPGAITLAVRLPPGSPLSSVAYAVQSSRAIVIARGSIPVSASAHATLSQEVVLPAGEGDVVTFVGRAGNSRGGAGAIYLGRTTFDVVPGHPTEVTFAAPSIAGHGALDVAGPAGGNGAGDTGSDDSALACQSCELTSPQGICDPPNITATSSTNPETGEQTGIGWGCGTLPTKVGQEACLALLRCFAASDCSQKGENPVMECYCGGASPDACLGGAGISGVCIPQYVAAATASAGGPAAGANPAETSRFIATSAADPTTAVGLADNIRHCAMETHCDACGAL